MIDYLQLITEPDEKIVEKGEVSKISRQLKILAKELKVPVIAHRSTFSWSRGNIAR